MDENNSPTSIRWVVNDGSNDHVIKHWQAPAANQHSDWSGVILLAPGYIPKIVYAGCTLNDDLWAHVVGYDINYLT